LIEDKNLSKFVLDDITYETTLSLKYRKRKPFLKQDKKKIAAVIPGLIEKVYIRKGTKVKAGDKLLILEAMKMKNDIVAPEDGTIKDVYIKEGSVVIKGELLLELE
jgi:biotin carboxyl carrier protein